MITRRVRHARSRRAFSLLELILAMAMMSMLALTLYTAMHIAIRAQRSATAAVEPTRAASIAADIVRQDFENVLPPTGTFAGAFTGLHQQGTGGDYDGADFYTLGRDEGQDDQPMADGIRHVELLIRPDLNSPALVRRVTRNLMPTTNPPVEEEVICRNVKSFSLRYFDGTAWQETWDSTTVSDVLPIQVAITVELNDPDPTNPSATPRKATRVIPMSCTRQDLLLGATSQ